MKCLHQEFCRLARQRKRTRNNFQRDRLLKRMMEVWKNVDNLIVDRPTRVPPSSMDEDSLARFR